MTNTSNHAPSGFSDLGQEPYVEVPTEPDAFLAWASRLDRSHPYKYELSNGKVSRMMINVSRAHWRVSGDLLGELLSKVDRSQFSAGPAEFGVRTPSGIHFPDALVEKRSHQLSDYASNEPVFIAEVLSPSTTGLDFTAKLHEYSAIPSLQTYLICSQDEPIAWSWTRGAGNLWPAEPATVKGREGVIDVGRLGISLSMGAIFLDIPDAPAG